MRKQLEDFLINISDFYTISQSKNYDNVISQSVDYLLEFIIGKEIDFKKARNFIFDNYKYKGFPELYVIKEALLNSEKKRSVSNDKEGCLITVQIPDKPIYAFEVCGYGKSINEIKENIISKYGNCEIKTYPKGSHLMGKIVITPDTNFALLNLGQFASLRNRGQI